MSFEPIPFLERAVRTQSNESVEEMRQLLVETLEAEGLEAVVDGNGNVLAEKGEGTPRVVLNTHIDTVSPHVPFERDEGTIRGRGSCDAKGPLTAMLDALFTMEATEGTVVLAVTPDEETYSTGAAALEIDADAFIVGEPTGLDVCTSARGRFQGTVEITGTGAHAADPTSGVNAISSVGHVIEGLSNFDDEFDPPTHSTLGCATLTPTLIEGGEAANRVPATVEITFDRRSVPPEEAGEFFESLESHLRSVADESVAIDVTPVERETPFLEAYETDREAAVVRAMEAAGAATIRSFGAGTEASYFAQQAPTVVFGPGVLSDEEGPVAHSEREYVTIESVREAGAILRTALQTLVG